MGEFSTDELSDLLMNGHNSSVYQVQNTSFTNQFSVRNCHKMTNCEHFQTKCCVKIAATLILTATDVFLIAYFDKNVTRMLQQERILSVFKNPSGEYELKFCDVMLSLLKIDEACCVNK